MDLEKTKIYYDEYSGDDACDCDYCQNYIDEIKNTYPELSDYLNSIGVDIEKPFEAMLPYKIDDETFEYPGVQYLICGNSEGFEGNKIENVDVFVTTSHPGATYKGEYFIIECYPIRLKIRSDKYSFS